MTTNNEIELELEEDLYHMIVNYLGTDDQKTIERWIETALQEYIKENNRYECGEDSALD
jgi:hypothetical protein